MAVRIATAIAFLSLFIVVPLVVTQMSAEVDGGSLTGGISDLVDRGPILFLIVTGFGLAAALVAGFMWLIRAR